MPPRREPVDPARNRPTDADQIADVMNNMAGTVLKTGITINPDSLGSPWRDNLRTAQSAILYSTSPGQTYASLTPDFVLLNRVSPDNHRIVKAIQKAHERGRFR